MKQHSIHVQHDTPRRRAFVSLEVVLVLPMLLLILLALFEFSFLFMARGAVVDAARSGARLATLHGVDRVHVEEEVIRSLGPGLGRYAAVDSRLGEYSGDDVLVRVQVPMSAATPDLLWPIGYSVKRRMLVAEAKMVKE